LFDYNYLTYLFEYITIYSNSQVVFKRNKEGSIMAKVVVIGAGLGGLPAAYELRHLLSNKHQVILISESDKFTFIPGLIRVALNLTSLSHVQLDLEPLAKRYGIDLVQSQVLGMDLEGKTITVEGGETIEYDYAVLATGASLNFEAIPGSGPHGGYTQSVCTPHHAMEAREAWLKLLANPGPIVVGAAPGAGCFGPAYEFALMADWELRRLRLRDKVSITYVTPEPYAGHLGVGGVEHAQELTADLLQRRDISVIDNAAITTVTPENIVLADGREVPFAYSMILPSFRGVKFIRETPGLGNEKGFIPILPTCRHCHLPSIYGLGVSVHLEQPEITPIPIGLPKSGQMAEAMSMAVSHNIAVELGELQAPLSTPTLEALCFAEFGDTGIAYIAVPVVPNPVQGKRRYSYAAQGAWVTWVKAAFEEYFLQKLRWGMGVPWFERLGLKILFGLSLLEPLPALVEKELIKSGGGISSRS
jgi:sulfide:quinone oxidoreductase